MLKKHDLLLLGIPLSYYLRCHTSSSIAPYIYKRSIKPVTHPSMDAIVHTETATDIENGPTNAMNEKNID